MTPADTLPVQFRNPLDPYFKFYKNLFDAMLYSLSGVELKIALAIERYTTGHYDQPHAEISISQLVKWTGCSKQAVLKARRRLVKEGVLFEVAEPTNRRAARLCVNRDPTTWGAFSWPRGHTGGEHETPPTPTPFTTGGAAARPLEVSNHHPLNGLNPIEEPSERNGVSGDRSESSPDDAAKNFYEGNRDAPSWLLSKLKHKNRLPGRRDD